MLGIMIIDMQEKWRKEIPEYLITKQIELIYFAKKNHLPIFTLEYINCEKTIQELSSILELVENMYLPKYCDDGFRIIQNPRTKQYHTDVITNPEEDYECYKNKLLIQSLNYKKITSIITTGIRKACCYFNTSYGAINEGFKVITSEELTDCKGIHTQTYRDKFQNHHDTLDELLANINI